MSSIDRAQTELVQGADLKTIVAALAEGSPYIEAKRPTNPPAIKMTDKFREGLRRLPEVFGRVQPEQRRQLTSDELEAAYAEYAVLKDVAGILAEREEAIKVIIRNHMDLLAEARGLAGAGTETDKHGHYVVARKGDPERVAIPNTDLDFSREYRGGSSDLSEERLFELYEAGEVSREDMLALTVERRVLDKNKIMTSVTKRPSLLKVLAAITERGRPSTSLYVRKTKLR